MNPAKISRRKDMTRVIPSNSEMALRVNLRQFSEIEKNTQLSNSEKDRIIRNLDNDLFRILSYRKSIREAAKV